MGLAAVAAGVVWIHRGDPGAGRAPAAGPATRARWSPAGSAPGGSAAPGAVAGAEATAARFAVAWWSYDWRDPPGRTAGVLRPLVTPPLAASLASGPGSPVLDQAATAEQRRVAVGAPAVSVADRSGTGIGLAVTAPVTVSSRGAAPVSARWAMEVLAVPSPSGWVIAHVQQ
ncbi:hypothetical protein K6U06_14965 [Acidiferrimicrobium sp. IK]|uniref:hypothetical protein n=1 Tax=Acidiferrimicrobium sp. IK TaxID=2871700 RepID=UPI0021CB1FF7|nr:hypothetical protein [Acidiferrimicrobium sp. IK]MCU4185667.1 hypothetical protein [Acidiferrimicrobium sp. IK]